MSKSPKVTIGGPEDEGTKYVGSEVCKTCHSEIYNTTKESAMYHALTVIDNGPPQIPFGSEDIMPPDEYRWSDLSLLIGGFEWSATFVSNDGYVVTQNMGSQFKMADQSESSIVLDKSSELCAKCHQMNLDNSIVSEGRFIAVGQYYEEWYSSGHNQVGNFLRKVWRI